MLSNSARFIYVLVRAVIQVLFSNLAAGDL